MHICFEHRSWDSTHQLSVGTVGLILEPSISTVGKQNAAVGGIVGISRRCFNEYNISCLLDELLKNFVLRVGVCNIEIVHKIEERCIVVALYWAVNMETKSLMKYWRDVCLRANRFIKQNEDHDEGNRECKLEKDRCHAAGPAVTLGVIH